MLIIQVSLGAIVVCLAWFILVVERERRKGIKSGRKEIEVQLLGFFKVHISLEENNMTMKNESVVVSPETQREGHESDQ